VSLARLRSGANALHQRGFALIAMLVLAAMITAYLITMGLNRSRAELSNDREDHDMQALRQAKAALIAYAASEQWQAYMGGPSRQPGGLPCPDLTNSGSSSGICSAAFQRVGRLPFVTIGSDDLRDASGERLWYAVSSNFYRNFGNNVINSDTKGLLTVTGSAATINAVAIVFAPGPPVQDSTLPGQVQDRRGANVNRTPSYLEGYTAAGADYAYASSPLPASTFNDRLLVITQAELMAAVEPVVAARIERTLKPILNTYMSQWKAFPFPARFDSPDPGTSGSGSTRSPMTYLGDPSKTSGLLPLAYVEVSAASNASPIVVTTSSAHALATGNTVWISGVGGNTAANSKWTVTVVDSTRFQLNGSSGSGGYTSGGIVTRSYPWSNWSVSKIGGSGRIDNDSCSTVSVPFFGLQCTFRARDDNCPPNNCIANLRFSVSADVGSNAGRSFATLPDVSNVSTTDPDNPGNPAFLSVSLTGKLDGVGIGTVTYAATLPIACVNTCIDHNTIVVTIPDVVSNPAISASDPNIGWFIGNEWYRQTYYALAPDFKPGGSNNCDPNPPYSPPCLTVKNLPPKYTVSNDKQAILILAGRVLNGSIRPSSVWNDYMEGANQTGPVNNVYEHRAGSPSSINDRVVVVAP
jgi:hypothetical protein